MYSEIIKELKNKINKEETEKNKLSETINSNKNALNIIQTLQDEYIHEKLKSEGKLATQLGTCPFPDECSKRKLCTEESCNADVCSNGYAYRFS